MSVLFKLFRPHSLSRSTHGFTLVEIVIACTIFPIIVIGIANAFNAVSVQYNIARQLNEIYAVLSACPEIDRALDYTSLVTGTNCYPNNNFQVEGGSSNVLTYTPTLTITDTSALSSSDPLKNVPDSKVIDISVNYIKLNAPSLRLKMLITRNGIGQL